MDKADLCAISGGDRSKENFAADLHPPRMLHDARMAGLVKLRCSAGNLGERPLWADRVAALHGFYITMGCLSETLNSLKG